MSIVKDFAALAMPSLTCSMKEGWDSTATVCEVLGAGSPLNLQGTEVLDFLVVRGGEGGREGRRTGRASRLGSLLKRIYRLAVGCFWSGYPCRRLRKRGVWRVSVDSRLVS